MATAEQWCWRAKAGLDLGTVLDLVGPGAGGSRIFQVRGPLMAANDYAPPTMRIIDVAKGHADHRGVRAGPRLPDAAVRPQRAVYEEALRMGLGDLDTAAVCKVFERDAGVPR